MKALEVSHLSKHYPSFQLEDISFCVEEGTIMGLIGRNGAGKTTTIKAILNLIHPTGGSLRCFGMNFRQQEAQIKQLTGYTAGNSVCYARKKIADIAKITSLFYEQWDDSAYRRYLKLFEIDEQKTPSQLSEGMKVKLNLAISLSHGARLLILDEPTSGLDPVSRTELLELFTALSRKGVAILFSTHLITDLEKCADSITYLCKGRLVTTGTTSEILTQCRESGIGNNLEEMMLHYEKQDYAHALDA